MRAQRGSRGSAVKVSTGDVRRFRLHAHHLAGRQPVGDLHEVVGACGVQDSPPGSALLAMNARVEDVTRDLVDRLHRVERSLLQSWCMRGAPFFFPRSAASTFTTGVLPATELARLHLIIGAKQALDRLGMGLDEAVDVVTDEVEPVLAQRRLAIGELGGEVAERVAAKLPPARRDAWRELGPYGADQPLGEAVVHFCLRILTLRGVVCLAPRVGNRAPFVLVGEWLGEPLPRVDPDLARANLLRRYLHCYGPSSREDFAAWVGVQAGDAGPWWTTVEDELIPVDDDGRRVWILADDLDALRWSPPVRGLRLLPPLDPYIQQRDRAAIVDQTRHRDVWRSVGAPGTVLADGRIAGTWRPRKAGRTLTVTVASFHPLRVAQRRQLGDEADRVARLRGASAVRVEVADAPG